ncbi:amidohydrolase family protein [Tenacibaculum sp. AHE15PA]|uniref:amidohydrolase family protein n=1 Tax=unclassified Tenacibaculum TaxID=2635139 RepID=UPI001C4E9956|nr:MULTISPECIES: amidohydrolase family protein [unclassified Tenacibaculum]QXP73924.1 amidohydrolase family protein [Tenacibaculum sp. AHE14PA]QXP75709.1 amidohydrolase family protein [Tenacibaculum sp. AHE15PA]
MKFKIIYSLVCFLFLGNILAQQTPAPKQTQDYSIEGATAHLGNGQVIENSLIMFSEGKIAFVGSAMMKIARRGTVINAKGKHVYPGFIAANTSLGLAEIDAVRATRDFDEVGSMLPHIRSIIAYNTESKVIESMRPNGVLMAQITPRGGVISGTSSIVQFDAWNWEDAALKTDDGIHMNWPSNFSNGRWWLGEEPGLKPNKDYAKNIAQITSYINNAKAYLVGDKTAKILPYEALQGVLNGSQKMFVHVSGQKAITDAVTTLKKVGIKNLVIVHGQEAEKVADLLKENNIPVILERAHRLPSAEDEDYDLPYRAAKILSDAGILIGLGMEGDMERMSARNIPFYAGTYAAYGLGKEKALQLITQNNAKILGVDDKVGTLEVGKDATLFISEGDALDMRTNILNEAFIQGRKISLESHQTKLWKRYSNKYKNQ